MNLTNFTPKKSILVWMFVFVFGGVIFAQDCGTRFSQADMQHHYDLLTLNGQYVPQDTCLNKTFSLVIHIVLDSSGDRGVTPLQLSQGIDTLNKYFKPICVRFSNCLIKEIKDFNYNKWKDDIHQPIIENTYRDTNVINIYLVESIITPITAAGGAAAGYAAPSEDLIVINKSKFNTLTSVHEMGHFFDLPHTFEPNNELVTRNSGCNLTGDGFCDTDADPYLDPASRSTTDPCGYQPGLRDAQGQYYTPPLDNIMSYWKCRVKFTQEQYNWMVRTMIYSKNYLH